MDLSILIPAFNCEDVIDEAIGSALRQAPEVDFEVVVVDDGSTDSTGERLRSWESRAQGRIRLGSHERNRGGAAARNTAARLASGDLLFMLDSDNVLPDGCVASQVKLLQETGLDAVSVGQLYYFEDSTSNVTDGWVQRQLDGRSTLRHLFESLKVPPAHGNYLYTRHLFDAVGGYPEDAAAMDTWTFGLKHLSRGFDIAIDRRSYYLHRVNRPNRESYWSREERRGTNDVNAVRELRREIEHLPVDLRALVEALRPNDRFFSLVSSGAFRADAPHLRSVRRRRRVEHAALKTMERTLAAGLKLRHAVRAHRQAD
jgi:glycosyltransferase involved in cell wall biosynthesis